MALTPRPLTEERPPSLTGSGEGGLTDAQRALIRQRAEAFLTPAVLNDPVRRAEVVDAITRRIGELNTKTPGAAENLINNLSLNQGMTAGLADVLTHAKIQPNEVTAAAREQLRQTSYQDPAKFRALAEVLKANGAGLHYSAEEQRAAARRRRLIAQQDAEERRRRHHGDGPDGGGDGESPAAKAARLRAKGDTPTARGPRGGSSRRYEMAGMGRPPHERPELPVVATESPHGLAAARAAERSVPVPAAADGVVPLADAPIIPVASRPVVRASVPVPA